MDANTTTRIATKAEKATASLEAVQARALQLAQAGTTNAEEWSRYANQVATAEGEATAWIRIQHTIRYFEREGMELTDAALLDTILELLGAGADDSWSGRTNDVARAKFDGIRKACNDAKYLVITD